MRTEIFVILVAALIILTGIAAAQMQGGPDGDHMMGPGMMSNMEGFDMGADVMTFPATMGNVTFPHKMHQEMLKNCKVCHANKPGKIEGFDKDVAHKLCIDCHKTMSNGMGPTTCKACHKKT
jgi:hypothetical protein